MLVGIADSSCSAIPENNHRRDCALYSDLGLPKLGAIARELTFALMEYQGMTISREGDEEVSKSIKELEQEMKTLMDLEVVRMKLRHLELMRKTLPPLIIAVTIGIIVAYFNWKIKP